MELEAHLLRIECTHDIYLLTEYEGKRFTERGEPAPSLFSLVCRKSNISGIKNKHSYITFWISDVVDWIDPFLGRSYCLCKKQGELHSRKLLLFPALAGFQRDTRSGKYSVSSMINDQWSMRYHDENPHAPDEKAKDWEHLGTFGQLGMAKT